MLPPPPPPPPAPLFGQSKETSANKTSLPDRSALLSQIQKGTTLKKAVTNDRSSPLTKGPKPSQGLSLSGASGGIKNGEGRSRTGSDLQPPVGGPVSLGNIFENGMPKLRSTGNRVSEDSKTLQIDKSFSSGIKRSVNNPATNNSSVSFLSKNFGSSENKFSPKSQSSEHNTSSAAFKSQNKFNTVKSFSSVSNNSTSRPPLPEGPKPALVKPPGNVFKQDTGNGSTPGKVNFKLSGSQPNLSSTTAHDSVNVSNNVKTLQKTFKFSNSHVPSVKPSNFSSHSHFGSLNNVKDAEGKLQNNLSHQSLSSETLNQNSLQGSKTISRINFKEWALNSQISESAQANHHPRPQLLTRGDLSATHSKKLPPTPLTSDHLPSKPIRPPTTGNPCIVKKSVEKAQDHPPPPSSPPPSPPTEPQNVHHSNKSPSLPPRTAALRHPSLPPHPNKSPQLPQRKTVPLPATPSREQQSNESSTATLTYNRPLPPVPSTTQRECEVPNFNQNRPLPAIPPPVPPEKNSKSILPVPGNLKLLPPSFTSKPTGNFESKFIRKFRGVNDLPKPEAFVNKPKTYLGRVPQRKPEPALHPSPATRPPPVPRA